MNQNDITILGIGNMLMRDEGFGVHLINHLMNHYTFPPEINLLDGGTSGIYLAPIVQDSRRLLVIDVVAMKGEPGEIFHFKGADLNSAGLQLHMSPHQMGLLEVLDICHLHGQEPEEVNFIGVIPAEVELGLELSPILQDRIEPIAKLVLKQIEEWTNARVLPSPRIAAPAP